MIILLILAFLVAMHFIGLGVIVAFVKETLHQSKIAREARKEQKRIMKQNKDNNRVQKTKLTKEEKMKIKHEANRVAYENNPKTIARKRFREEFGHEFMERGTTQGYRKGQRYQEIKREVKAELKRKKREDKNK